MHDRDIERITAETEATCFHLTALTFQVVGEIGGKKVVRDGVLYRSKDETVSEFLSRYQKLMVSKLGKQIRII